MPKIIYKDIYYDLKKKIEEEVYPYQALLPSENALIKEYSCSRNTLRRAIADLVGIGYLQTMQGKGMRNIYRPIEHTFFTLGEVETFKESSLRNGKKARTEVLLFTELKVNDKQAKFTGFPEHTEVFYIQRLHFMEDIPVILNHNYFLKERMPNLTGEIAKNSIYEYLEHTLHLTIVNSKRVMTVEKITEIDEKYLNLNAYDYNCLAVISSQTFDDNGIMFEFTESRHKPEYFKFYDNAVRR